MKDLDQRLVEAEKRLVAMEKEAKAMKDRISYLEAHLPGKRQARSDKPTNPVARKAAIDAGVHQNDWSFYDEYLKHYRVPT